MGFDLLKGIVLIITVTIISAIGIHLNHEYYDTEEMEVVVTDKYTQVDTHTEFIPFPHKREKTFYYLKGQGETDNYKLDKDLWVSADTGQTLFAEVNKYNHIVSYKNTH